MTIARLILLAFVGFAGFTAAGSEVNLRVMSWNVEGWAQSASSAQAQAAQMHASGAHVIALQECDDGFLPVYKSELERLTGVTWYNGPNKPAILSRYPIIESSWQDIGRNTWGANRTASRIKITVNGVALTIFNTHLDIGGPPEWGEGYRTENVNNLMPWCRSFAGPKLLLGDMNSHWDTWWINQIKVDYIDTWTETANSQGWSAPPTNEANWRPDYLFRSKDSAGVIRTVNSWVIGTPWTLSDHRPIVADMGITGGGTATQSPYGGTARAIPGTIQAEHFDEGGQYLAYSDNSAGNSGGDLRSTDVDIEACTDTGAGHNVGWIATGEWLEYTVNVASSGTYTLEARVTSTASGAALRVEFGGTDKTGTLSVPNTGGWQAWTTVTKTGVALNAGQQVMRVYVVAGGFNLNWVRLTAASTQSPYGGTVRAIPGTIEAEHFDESGQNVAYLDEDTGNNGGKFRSTDVDVETASDSSGNYCVGWIGTGELLEYTVNVASAGTYTLDARVAGFGGSFRVEFAGVDKTGTIACPSTGNWQSWTTVSKSGLSLSAGQQVMRVYMVSSGFNLNWVRLTSASANTPPVIVSGATANPNPAQASESISFTAAASDANGDALAYNWNFGDGTSAAGASVNHTYGAAGSYTATVTITDGRGGSITSSVIVTVTAAGWTSTDVGAVGVAGTYSTNGSSYTINASGIETIGTADAFHFVYQQLSGDGQIVARVSSIQNTSEWSQAGVMMRESLTANSRHAHMLVTQVDRCKFRRRYTTGGATTSSGLSPGSGMQLPQWLKLVRQGNTFTGYRSDNGSTWILIGSDTVVMPSTIYIGLFAASAVNTVRGSATIDNVSMSGAVTGRSLNALGMVSAADPTVDLGIFSQGDKEAVHVYLPIPEELAGAVSIKFKAADRKSLPKGINVAAGKVKGNAQYTGTFTFNVIASGKVQTTKPDGKKATKIITVTVQHTMTIER